MNKKLGILILILLSLVSTSIFLTKKETDDTQTIPIEEVMGESLTECTRLEEQAKEQIANIPSLRQWYVKSPSIKDNEINIEIELTDEETFVMYSLNENRNKATYADGIWTINIPINELESNQYKLLIEATVCDNTISKSFSFNVSNPVYVVWTIDWEGFDVKEEYLTQMANISTKYNAPMTHFFNPYIYLYLSNERAQYLTDWVKSREGEDIGLHLHMYDNLVKASGVEINNDPAWGSPTGKGHDTPTSNYGYDDFRKIIVWALAQYEKYNLPKPTMYRAGGWYIDEENILVLKNFAFNIESSGRTYYRHGRNLLEGHWNLLETTQPYQMNSKDQNLQNNPDINIWQYPNNGGDSWAYTSEMLISRFKQNYAGGITQRDVVINYLSHPHWFDKEGPNIEGALKYISAYTYDQDNGPIIFVTLDNVYQYTVKH